MKVKLLNVLTVCVVTLAVLSPGLVVFGVIWGRHIELVKTQNLSCEVNHNSIGTHALAPHPDGTHPSQYQASTKLSNRTFLRRLQMATEHYQIATILQWLCLFTPICIGLGIIGYDRYLVYRAAVLQEQIEMLERLWQHSIEQ
ncbi:hypothetical protein Cylst_5494 [Cylindrospermum stagnale PCC 7417]|uniref:Uncharacterized protein n=1 Tax=Cylindrospermum stagnale PCC 7417 TaxID=56107 RepID=K9X4C4_9NOST|nr:hypothetical protein [Cylindrospermum stagnale]AFZ27505.1 hypothetical protein Cylst_5494 [Cylindrospermum stagnale PCC 7417]